MFETAETRWGIQAARQFTRAAVPPAYLLAARLNLARRDPYIAPAGHHKKVSVCVRVNHGVWQARCPFCPSAQHASEDGLFYCAGCLNSKVGNKTVALLWPENRAEIEEQLLERPAAQFRNWEWGETIDDLKRQDEEALSG